MQLVLAYGVCSAQHAGWRADQRCTGRGGTLLFDNRSPTVSTSKGILQLESSDVSSRRSARRMKGMPWLGGGGGTLGKSRHIQGEEISMEQIRGLI